MQEIFLKVRYFERGLSKSLKKITSFFLLNPVLFNGQNCKNQKEHGTGDQSFFMLQNRFSKISLLLVYYLTKFDYVIQSGF